MNPRSVYRPVDGDGDILMADAHPHQRIDSPPIFTAVPTRQRPQRAPARQRHRQLRPEVPRHQGHIPSNSTDIPTSYSTVPNSHTTSGRASFASSSFGNQLRHLPLPLPSRVNQIQTYASQPPISPTPSSPQTHSLPPLRSVIDSYRREDTNAQSFSRTARSPELVDLTQNSSSPRSPLNPTSTAQNNPRAARDHFDFTLEQFRARRRHVAMENPWPINTLVGGNGEYVLLRPSPDLRRLPPADLDHRRSGRQVIPKTPCTACMEDFKRDDLIQLACNCRYCPPCLNMSFRAGCANMASFPPKCCGTPIRISVWGSLLEPETLSLYKKVEAEFSANRPLYCAAPKCSTFIAERDVLFQSEVGVCPKCANSTCKRCRRLMSDHPVWPVEERVCPKEEDNVLKLHALGSENKWKQCPTCLNMVERTEGCNHMDCICGVEFCYRCGSLFDEEDTCNCDPDMFEDEDGYDESDNESIEHGEEEQEEDDASSDHEWPDYRAAVDPAGRPKCLHRDTTPLGETRFTCHGCLQRELLLTCDDCGLELCITCIAKIQRSADSNDNDGGAGDVDNGDSDATLDHEPTSVQNGRTNTSLPGLPRVRLGQRLRDGMNVNSQP